MCLLQTGTVRFRRRQFPIRLAYASTSNRLQGGTYVFVGLDGRLLFFSHGQFYVTGSRVESRYDFVVAGLPAVPGVDRPVIRNIVYRDMIESRPDRPVPAPPMPRRPVPLLDLGIESGDDEAGEQWSSRRHP